ncbi:MAG: fibronectin type III domain-containing protein [Minisyncoccia bacterium]
MKNIIQKFSLVLVLCAVFVVFGANKAQAAVVMQTGSYTANITTATLNGTYNTDGLSMDVWFSYADNAVFYGAKDTTHENVNGVNLSYSKTITGLVSGKRYYYRIMGEGHGLFPSGSLASFVTDSVATSADPSVMTLGYDNVTTNSATISCILNTGNEPTANVYFEYGTSSTNLNNQTTTQKLASGSTCSFDITNLTPDTTYYYRPIAENSVSVVRANTIGQFKTLKNGSNSSVVLPNISVSSAYSITAYSAVLPCSFSTGGDANVSIYFDYVDNNGQHYTTLPQVYTTGSACAVYISNLVPNSQYRFQAFAKNSVGTTNSNSQNFKTQPDGFQGTLTVNTNNVYNIGTNSANVSCSFTTGGYPTVDVYFEYGQNGYFYNRTNPQTLSIGSTCVGYMYNLIPNTQYNVRAVASGNNGIVYGYSFNFTTLPFGNGSNSTNLTNVTVLAKSATTKSIVVSGIVYGTSNNVKTWFEYGPTTALGQTTIPSYINLNNTQVYSATISDLKPGTMYYYRAVAMDQKSVSRGDINYVKTLSGAVGGSIKVETGPAVKNNKTILDKASDPFNFGNGQGAAALFGFGTGFFPTSLFGWLLLTFMLLLLIVLSRHYFAKKEEKK